MAYMKDKNGYRLDGLAVAVKPLIDTGSGYAARPSTSLVPAGAQTYQGVGTPADAQTGDRWQPVYTPRPTIIDTDWYTDVDDVVAMRVAAHYERVGKIDILACVLDTTAPNGAPSLDAYWRTEGRPMSIGQLPGSNSDLTSGGPFQAALMNREHYGVDATVYPDSTTVYRTALAAAADGSVDIVSIGYLNAIQSLMLSTGDSIDARTGPALVAAKVRRLHIMGGRNPASAGQPENNFARSLKSRTAASYVVANWPTTVPIYFAGYEVGGTVLTGDNLINLAPTTDPLYVALATYPVANTLINGRNSWDPMCVEMAALGVSAAGYTTVRGTNAVDASTGENTFTTSSSGPHYYVVKALSDATYKARINDVLIPGRQPKPPTGIQVKQADGTWKAASYLDRNLGRNSALVAGTTDLGALASFDAADIAVSDGTAVTTVAGANSYPDWTQATTAAKPTYRANIGGRKCIEFDGGDWLDTVTGVPQSQAQTVYALVRFATLPSSNQTIVSDDDGLVSVTVPDRSFHLKVISGGVAQAVAFVNNAGTSQGATDNYTGVTANTWQVIVHRRTATTVEALIDGNTDTPSTPAGGLAPQFSSNPLHIGNSKHPSGTPSESMVGYLSKVKVYSGAHSPSQVAAAIAQLLA